MKSIYEKRYISEAQALKAAQKAGCSEVIKDGKTWRVKTPGELAPQKSARQESEAAILELQAAIAECKTVECTTNLLDRLNDIAKQYKLAEAIVAALDDAIGLRAQEIEADAELTRAQVTAVADTKNGKPWVRASSIEKPTKRVWAIADEMYAAAEAEGKAMPSRSEVQAECVRRGIASGTARTQFQHWFKCRNEAAAAPRAQIVDGKIIPAK